MVPLGSLLGDTYIYINMVTGKTSYCQRNDLWQMAMEKNEEGKLEKKIIRNEGKKRIRE